ncbi:MAG: hypothetical protein WEB62_03890 [Bacteroidota bacterium]
MKRTFFLVFLAGVLPLSAQVQWSGEVSAYLAKSDRSQNPRVINKGIPTFGWRFDLFLDGVITENVFALANLRVMEDEHVYLDYAALRVTDLASLGINLQVGKFDMPFGNLGERRFPERNFLYGLPIIYEYRMALPGSVVTKAELLNSRGRGVGMRLIDYGVYDMGAMIFGDVGPLHYAVAVSNGTISSSYSQALNANDDFNKILRLAYTPMLGLTIGGSASMTAYLPAEGKPIPRGGSVEDYVQRIGEVDLEFSRGRFRFFGQAVYSEWDVPLDTQDEKLSVLGFYAEAKYTWVPRWYTAARVSGLRFSQHDFQGVQRRWDYDMLEVEAGIGYALDRNAVVKLVRRETRTLGITDPHDNLTVLQFAVAF